MLLLYYTLVDVSNKRGFSVLAWVYRWKFVWRAYSPKVLDGIAHTKAVKCLMRTWSDRNIWWLLCEFDHQVFVFFWLFTVTIRDASFAEFSTLFGIKVAYYDWRERFVDLKGIKLCILLGCLKLNLNETCINTRCARRRDCLQSGHSC